MAGKETEEYGWRTALAQWRFMAHELKLMTQGKPRRWAVLFFAPPAGVIISYRLDRSGYLFFREAWIALRVLAFPLFLGLRLLSCRHEICFKADIGRGLQIWHPTLGVAVHGDAIVGQNCIFYGDSISSL